MRVHAPPPRRWPSSGPRSWIQKTQGKACAPFSRSARPTTWVADVNAAAPEPVLHLLSLARRSPDAARQNPYRRRPLRRGPDRQSVRRYPSGLDEHASRAARRLLPTYLRISEEALSPHTVFCRHALYRRPDYPRSYVHRRAVEGDAARTLERRQYPRRRGGRGVAGRFDDHALRSSRREFLLWSRRGTARQRRSTPTEIACLLILQNSRRAGEALS